MFPDHDDAHFQTICEALQRTAICYYSSTPMSKTMDEFFNMNSVYIRRLFHTLVTPPAQDMADGPSQSKPRIISIPSPTAIHSYIRALGLIRDFEGLYSLASWIVRFHPLLFRRADTQVKGRRRIRDALVGIRVFLERSWVTVDEQDQRVQAPAELIELVREKIESAPDLEGWPTDEEVDAYLQRQSNRRSLNIGKVF